MSQPLDTSPAATDDCVALDARITERTRRCKALLDLDKALSAAADRHSLAAQLVHHGWGRRAD